MAYTETQEYMKFLKKKASETEDEDCGCEGSTEECSCCPPGLIAIFDDAKKHLGCVTPNDAEQFQKNTFTCADGYVKLFNTSTGAFLGCVTETEFAALYTTVNP